MRHLFHSTEGCNCLLGTKKEATATSTYRIHCNVYTRYESSQQSAARLGQHKINAISKYRLLYWERGKNKMLHDTGIPALQNMELLRTTGLKHVYSNEVSRVSEAILDVTLTLVEQRSGALSDIRTFIFKL